MNQKKLPGYAVSSLSLHQFEAIQEENESHDSNAAPRRNTKNSKLGMRSRGDTENTMATKLKSIKPSVVSKKISIKPELSQGDIKFNDLYFAYLFRPKQKK
jgi:hypothetical protein